MKLSVNLIKNNFFQKTGIFFGMIASIIFIVLWAILVFHTKIYIFVLTQILPAIVGLIASVIKKVWLLSISFIILLPIGLTNRYFLLGLAFYLLSIILLVIGSRVTRMADNSSS